jgi:hypothetical protein
VTAVGAEAAVGGAAAVVVEVAAAAVEVGEIGYLRRWKSRYL